MAWGKCKPMLLDLSLVSLTLSRLIHDAVKASSAWPGVALLVSAQPPDKLTGDNTLGFYLYHIMESAAYKNAPPPGLDRTPVRLSPMGLELYYQLSAHSDLINETGPLREQLMMGLAMKALHDFPQVDDQTEIKGVRIMETGLRGSANRLRISLQPLQPERSVEFWTAGTHPMRLAVYYQVSVALLEPEESTRSASRVLSYGVYPFTNQGPRLESSQNTLVFSLPGESAKRETDLRPAQVPFNEKVTFTGTGLEGDQVTLRLTNSRWSAPQDCDAAWAVTAKPGQVEAIIQKMAPANLLPPAGQVVLPGVYGAAVKVVRRQKTPDGTEKDFEFISNETAFVISPRVDGIVGPNGAGVVTVTGYIFRHAELPADSVQVYAGETRLTPGTVGALAPAQFAVVSATTLEVSLPAGLAPQTRLPLRIFVNGAETPPNWVVLP